MKFELTINELGKLLKKLGEEYKLDLLAKIKLSGGWMTLNGEAIIEQVPVEGLNKIKGNNIITIRVKSDNEEGAPIKITGAKDSKFNIDLSATRYKEVNFRKLNLDTIKINNEECKLRIDEDLIFKINASVDEVKKFI
ncbi:hypothetical protein J2Z53_000941 [Clostridium moniliforme]|uniref:UDP-N-acetylglucosamine pyrophosphorylase n=1 Tax=Clostridium moniliforme TaxID=39489 RepID=A0ABS4EZE6_9CLOT|nr:UDP-N-acetylglucosamine pyrophosphorylase [Clostridium moniliforme]MBP1889360.1 hypothetical protein [Clostridium moniliforme]